MPAVHQKSGEISIPSGSNRDLALFLMFLGLALSFPVRALAELARPQWSNWTGVLGPLGLSVVGLGVVLYRYTRKRFSVEEKTVSIQDGWVRRKLRYTWQEEPKIRLRSQEEEHNGRTIEFWLVNLVDGKRQYVLDRREGSQIESRSLAEALAKTINCPVLEKCESGEIKIPREELDLPFRERVRRNPDLLGPEMGKPEGCSVREETRDEGRSYHWKLLNRSMLNEYLTLVFLVFFLAVVPIFSQTPPGGDIPERFQASFFDLARQGKQFTYFWVTGGLLAVTGLFLFGYSKELDISPSRLHAQDRLWGIPCWSATIPAERLEEIWVRQSSRGAHLELVSDDCIISGRISDSQVAGWLASQLRRFYS